MPLRRSSARSLHPAPHLQMGLPQVRTSGVLHTDVSQALLHLDIASGHSGHLRMVIFTVWADPHAAFLRPVSAPSNTHLDRGESLILLFPQTCCNSLWPEWSSVLQPLLGLGSCPCVAPLFNLCNPHRIWACSNQLHHLCTSSVKRQTCHRSMYL